MSSCNPIFDKCRILVGITAQTVGEKLIDYAYQLSQELSGELYVLHIEKGNDIFRTEAAALQLQRLFIHASKCGANINAICGQDIYSVFKNFIKDKKISDLVIGEAKAEDEGQNVYDRLAEAIPHLTIHIIGK